MSLNIEQKKAVVAEVAAAIAPARASVLAEYRGLSVAQLTALRIAAREHGVWVKVVKNNLARRVVKGSAFECLSECFVGPVIFSASEDAVAVARVMCEFAQKHEALNITAAAMNGIAIDMATVRALAKLPGREALLTQLAGVMQAPIQKLAATLHEVPAKFARAVCAAAQARDGV